MNADSTITISRNGQQFGPYTLDEVRNYLATGSLVSTDLAWNNATSGWIPLSSYPGLGSYAASSSHSGGRNVFLVIFMGIVWWIGLAIFSFIALVIIATCLAPLVYPNDTPHDAGYKLGHTLGFFFFPFLLVEMGLVIWLTIIGKLPGTGYKRN